MIVATAGHIDHGKTCLVRALTGVDTDRLPEERARGISIDLGFAHADLGERRCVSFIDVPGHERFIRNMLAGVTGIDAALLVVAADDGVMPQTLEHLQILDLLDVTHAAVVITKVDLVPAQRVEAVADVVRALLANTSLDAAPVFPVSSASRLGFPGLLEWLKDGAFRAASPADGAHRFRMPIDRAFTMTGSGTIVTGTVRSGVVRAGDQLVVSPAGREVRVRRLHVQGAGAEEAGPGQRCALNLVGVGVDRVGRGDWVLEATAHAPTDRLDARLRVLASEAHAFEHWTAVHLHLGTTDVSARVAVPREASIAAGESGFVQLVTERPIAALHSDRFVIRDQNARRTLGGGVVLDPFAPKRKRSAGLRAAELQVYERHSPSRILAGLLNLSEGGVDLQAFAQSMNLTSRAAEFAQRDADVMAFGKPRAIGITRTAAEALTVRVLTAVRSFHTAQPRAAGIEAESLRALVAPRLNSMAFQAFMRNLANRQLLVLSNDLARLREHDACANPEDEQLWKRVRAALVRAGVHPPLLGELATALKLKEQPLRDFLHRKCRTGEVRKIAAERFCLRETLASLAATAAALASSKEDEFFTARDFRDAIGTGRGLAIHYLEFFDQLGITQRFGDRRRIGKDFSLQLGKAASTGDHISPTRHLTPK